MRIFSPVLLFCVFFAVFCLHAHAGESVFISGNAREARLKHRASLVRVGASYGPLINTAGSTINKNAVGAGGFIDVMFYRHRLHNLYGFDIYCRFHGRHYRPTGIDLKKILVENIPYKNTFYFLGGDVGLRLAYRFYFLRTLWDVYFMAASRFVYTRSVSEDVYTGRKFNEKKFYSIGFISGAGFEVTFLPWVGLFIEYNYGYVPVGESERNIEGHQLYAGVTSRIMIR